jgi:hypothetical protein
LSGDPQSDSESALSAAQHRAFEFLEDARLISFRNADSVIFDLKYGM